MSKLELKPPLKIFNITQKFGNKNPKLYNSAGHSGVDATAVHGTPIYASHDGLASYQVDSGGGHGVVILTDKEYDFENGTAFFKTIYWHMVDFLKEPKYKSPIADKTGFIPVKTGDLIGYADNTGHSTGSHLHFGLKPVDKGEDWGTWYNLKQNNGYYGAIDPEPYLPKFEMKNKYIYLKNLKFGDKGEDVKNLQKDLISLGYLIPTEKVDGIYGAKTQLGVFFFQINQGVIKFPIESNKGYYFGVKSRTKMNSLK